MYKNIYINKNIDKYILIYNGIILYIESYLYDKLLSLYKRNEMNEMNLFHTYLFELLFNYHILDGISHQWSIPSTIFTELNITRELYASPFNSCAPKYHSIFNIDKIFGSNGCAENLLDSDIEDGIYEVDPPHIEKIICNGFNIIKTLLQMETNENKNLIFIFIIPYWIDMIAYKESCTSDFLIDKLILNAYEHHYIKLNGHKITSIFDTCIFIHGTKSGKVEWIDKKLSEKLVTTWVL